MKYFDRKGKVISFRKWYNLSLSREYISVQSTELSNGRFVSTIWLGLDHRFSKMGPPLVFESIVWAGRPGSLVEDTLGFDRYSTEAEAKAGHKRLCEQFS